MHLALWDIPPCRCLEAAASDMLVERTTAARAMELLRAQQVDVALLPSSVVLCEARVFDVLPDAAVASWAYPWASIVLRREAHALRTVAFDPSCRQEAIMAKAVLREHYRVTPAFVPVAGCEDPLRMGADASLVVGTESMGDPGQVLDLGQEWFELAQYPMVWGVFATLRGAATPSMAARIAELAKDAEVVARSLAVDSGTESERRFYAESLRLQMDDIAVAGLTELTDQLYFAGHIQDLTPLPLYSLPATDGRWWQAGGMGAEDE